MENDRVNTRCPPSASIHAHIGMYTGIHICTHTTHSACIHVSVYTHTHTPIIKERREKEADKCKFFQEFDMVMHACNPRRLEQGDSSQVLVPVKKKSKT